LRWVQESGVYHSASNIETGRRLTTDGIVTSVPDGSALLGKVGTFVSDATPTDNLAVTDGKGVPVA